MEEVAQQPTSLVASLPLFVSEHYTAQDRCCDLSLGLQVWRVYVDPKACFRNSA